MTKRSAAMIRAQDKYHGEWMKWLQSVKEPCSHCGETDPRCITFHHLDPAEKSFTIGSRGTRNKLKILEEKKKCICLCYNCHYKEHRELYL